MSSKNETLYGRLMGVYGHKSIDRDVFGTRQATPKEIENRMMINDPGRFAQMEEYYPPADEDIETKIAPQFNYKPRGKKCRRA